jgi:DNA-binding NarL/FixJ family response regulator
VSATRSADFDQRELAALRGAAAALARQDGRGIPRRAVVELATAAVRHELRLYAGEPALAVVRPLERGALAGLTAREREVAALVAHGRSNRAIADELVIAVSTAKDHVHHILAKSGLPNRAAIAAAWWRS